MLFKSFFHVNTRTYVHYQTVLKHYPLHNNRKKKTSDCLLNRKIIFPFSFYFVQPYNTKMPQLEKQLSQKLHQAKWGSLDQNFLILTAVVLQSKNIQLSPSILHQGISSIFQFQKLPMNMSLPVLYSLETINIFGDFNRKISLKKESLKQEQLYLPNGLSESNSKTSLFHQWFFHQEASVNISFGFWNLFR